MEYSDLVQRFYDITGDDPSLSGRNFPRTRVNTLMNEGALRFRMMVEDKWARTEEATVASQGVYNFPDNALMLIRVAFDRETLEARSILSIVAEDAKWETRESTVPSSWTTDGLGHSQYRVWPTPSVSGSTITFQADTAGPASAGDDDGIFISTEIDKPVGSPDTVTFTGSPYTPDPDPDEHVGVTATADTEWTILGDNGVVASYQADDVLTLWYIERPETFAANSDPIPLKNAYQLAPLYYALWKSYEEEGDHNNPILAELYKGKFAEISERGRRRAENPVPRMIHQLGGKPVRDQVRHPFLGDQVTISGSPVTIHFPKRVRYQ
jgi:hypothetical protein